MEDQRYKFRGLLHPNPNPPSHLANDPNSPYQGSHLPDTNHSIHQLKLTPTLDYHAYLG